MNKSERELKELVKSKYSEIANLDPAANRASCCGGTCGSDEVYNIMTDDYSGLGGYKEEADLGLGCGLPTAYAGIKQGDTVVDLGSGAGNDCFVARHEAGDTGKVIGIDFSESMLKKARQNVDNLGYNNVEFRLGDIEDIPVGDNAADVVISNCVLNLVPNKSAVMREIFRILKPGGHFSISDIVLEGVLPSGLREDAEMYVGCVSGAVQRSDYLRFIKEAGFKDIIIQKSKPIHIPGDILSKHLSADQISNMDKSGLGIFSITVRGLKPDILDRGHTYKENVNNTNKQDKPGNCKPGSGCC
jgi:SAM-dependent methyltransferase